MNKDCEGEGIFNSKYLKKRKYILLIINKVNKM